MTPKEKAAELIEKMNVIHYMTLSKKNGKLPISMYSSQIKQCALIAVDEIKAAVKRDSDFTVTYEKAQKYWANVKQEIENL